VLPQCGGSISGLYATAIVFEFDSTLMMTNAANQIVERWARKEKKVEKRVKHALV
jgi:hypothetical protein